MDLPPQELSPNKTMSSKVRGHHKKRYRDAQHFLAKSLIPSGYHAPKKARISYTLCTSPRMGLVDGKPCRVVDYLYRPQDEDNAVACIKSLQDALVRAGALIGDKREQLELGRPVIDKERGPYILVEIESLDETPAPWWDR
jgi:hypothetical protein